MYGSPAVPCLPARRYGLRAVIQDRVGEKLRQNQCPDGEHIQQVQLEELSGLQGACRRYCTEYIYDFKYAFLGDNSFYIYAVFQYDADSFAAEAARIEETPGLDSSLPDCIEAGGKTYYLVNGEADGFYGFSSYCDDETLDGKPYCMDVAAVDTQRMSIEYLTAFQWDAGKDEFVVGFLSPLLE